MRSPPMPNLPVTRVVLYKHGVGYFEREGAVEGDAALTLTFKQAEVSDVLKSLTVLDLDGGHVASVSYDSTKPLEQLLAEVALSIPDEGSLVGLLTQVKGARVAVLRAGAGGMSLRPGESDGRVEGLILGIDTSERQTADGVVRAVLLSLVTDAGDVRAFDLGSVARVEILDEALRRDLDYYLRTQLSAKKKDARTFTLFCQGNGRRRVRVSYTVGAPVWKATYRILLGQENQPPLIQGWAVVDNTQDEDWLQVNLSLVAGLPVSFQHDLYTPRFIRRPVVEVQETTGVLPPTVEEGVDVAAYHAEALSLGLEEPAAAPAAAPVYGKTLSGGMRSRGLSREAFQASAPAHGRERKHGDLFEPEIAHPVTIRRNQSALVPIVQRPSEGRPVLLYNRANRAANPLRAVELKNTTGLTLEGGPVTVLEADSYVGEAMLDTLKPDEQRLVPYAVELSVHVLDNIKSWSEKVHRIVIHKGILTEYTARVQLTTYQFANRADTAQTLYLEHPRPGSDWSLMDGLSPHETTENYWRFKLTLAPKQVTQFAVRQKQPAEQQLGVHHVNSQ